MKCNYASIKYKGTIFFIVYSMGNLFTHLFRRLRREQSTPPHNKRTNDQQSERIHKLFDEQENRRGGTRKRTNYQQIARVFHEHNVGRQGTRKKQR